jgi:Lon protease-like protein
MAALAMFPLGSVLLPGAVLPLHVFEPRYHQLMTDCLAGTPEFGVVLIERGSEVGGGDVRTDVGTVARIVAAEEFAPGRWQVVAVGTRRLRVERWLDDDPYPRAEVVEWDDGDGDPGDAGAYARLLGGAQAVLALARDAGLPVDVEDLDRLASSPPAAGSFAVAGLLPIGPLDRQRVLATGGVGARLALLEELLVDVRILLEARLGG